jgi:hypothetical protein
MKGLRRASEDGGKKGGEGEEVEKEKRTKSGKVRVIVSERHFFFFFFPVCLKPMMDQSVSQSLKEYWSRV